ncbi:MAG TPA: alpha/beta fold hydrolase [Ignavibacteria bacterium]|nr:alpha/beta hydrolase [Bacteroidota bacterium]HRI84691.1 alpha/beta fold hydrolase [Ignavibacteria bacterium]HRK00240.1 alpha/beta fold hydrolase [Ignavibacteria bacterium]
MKDLILLHGAIGSSKQLENIAETLKNDYRITLLNFSGHGGKKIPEEKFSIEMFADDVLYLLDKSRKDNADIFGYSMGGYAALYIARHYPGKLNRVFTLGTKFNWNPEISQKEIRMLNPEKIEEKLPEFADELKERHSPEDWKIVLSKTSEMMTDLGNKNTLSDEDFRLIDNEVMITVGDSDKMVSSEESKHVSELLINGRFMLLPDTLHPIEKVSVELITNAFRNFFK